MIVQIRRDLQISIEAFMSGIHHGLARGFASVMHTPARRLLQKQPFMEFER